MEEEQFLSSELSVQLSDIVATIVSEKPDDALGLFESLATFHRTGKMVSDPVAGVYLGEDGVAKVVVPKSRFQDVAWAKQYCELVVPKKPAKKAPKEGEGEEEEPEASPEETEDKGELADVVAEQHSFNLLGVGLKAGEAYRIAVSLKRLMDRENVKYVRFWGKVHALKGSYYIAETEVDTDREPEEAEQEGDGEEEGQSKGPETILNVLKTAQGVVQQSPPAEGANQPGANKYRYWVTTDMTTWTRLPDVKPAYIQSARLITKLFTGDLDATVACHPPFPGTEQEYLRAQIARISHGCKLAPKGTYEPPPEDEPEEDAPPKTTFKIPPYETLPELTAVAMDELPEADDEAWQKPAFAMWGRGYQDDTLMVVDNWVHTEVPLLQLQGRTTEHKFPKEGEEEEEEAEAEAKPPLELIAPLCTEIVKDDKLECPQHSTQQQPSWAVRKAYAQPSAAARQSYLVRSLRWPGAYCAAQCLASKPGATFSNTYIGDGVKAGATHAYSPPTPNVTTTDTAKHASLLQRDYTPDDELEFAPPPPPPAAVVPEEEEEENDDE